MPAPAGTVNPSLSFPSSKFEIVPPKESLYDKTTNTEGSESNVQDKPSATSERPSSEAKINILIFGSTGSGKSTFINLASGPDSERLEVSDSLESCTRELKPVTYTDANRRQITLIDSPGFDDTSRDDSEIVKSIATFLKDQYENKSTVLHGMVYLHRISDSKMTRSAIRSWEIFTLLCGNYALKNVMIVTNRWETVSTGSEAEKEREKKLKNKYFKTAIERGAKLFRYHNSLEDLADIINTISQNIPTPLAIQAEMVTLGYKFEDTAVGRNVRPPPTSPPQSPDPGIAALNTSGGYPPSTIQSSNSCRNNKSGGSPKKWYDSWKAIGNCERVAVMNEIWRRDVEPWKFGFDDPSGILLCALDHTFSPGEQLKNKEDCKNWLNNNDNQRKFKELQSVIKGPSIKNRILNSIGLRRGLLSRSGKRVQNYKPILPGPSRAI